MREAMSSKGTLTCLKGRPMWTSWSSTRQSARSSTWIRAILNICTDWGMKGLRAALWRRPWGTSGWKVGHEPRKPTISLAASKAAWPSGQGRWLCPSSLLWWDPTWSLAFSSGATSTGKTWTCWSEGHKSDQRAGTPLLWEKAEGVGAISALRRAGCGETLLRSFST